MKKIIILFFGIALLVLSTTKAEIPQERIEQIRSQIYREREHIIRRCGKDTAIEILTMPVKKLTFQQQYYNNHFVSSTTDEWIVMAYNSCDTFLYGRYNLSPNQTANIIGIRGQDYDKNIKKMIFNNRNDSAFFCYFFNGIFSSDIFFFAKIKKNNIILQNLRTNIEYTVDSLLLFKFGSIEKYKELLQEEAEAEAIWMETPKTAKDAYQFLKNDCETYFSCYPEDTIAAVLMFIDDVATSVNLSITQKNALEYKIINAIHAHNNISKSYNSENSIIVASMFYSDPSKGIYGIYLKGLRFSDVLESILTKQQMETYLKHYKKQQSIRNTIKNALFPPARGVFVPEYRLHWNNYVANKYKDAQDFLRKKVFKKPDEFAQNNEISQFTKEEAIAIIKANYLYMNFRYPEDTIANINRFIDNINEIVPLDREKRDKIKVLILSEIKQKEKTRSVEFVLSSGGWYDWPDFIFIMGINANDIIRDCFNSSDCKKIYYKLSKDKTNAGKAYHCLKMETEQIHITNEANPKGSINFIFDHYGI